MRVSSTVVPSFGRPLSSDVVEKYGFAKLSHKEAKQLYDKRAKIEKKQQSRQTLSESRESRERHRSEQSSLGK